MKKISFLILLFSLIYVPLSLCSDKDEIHRFQGTGAVTSVDPLYSRVTIEHSAIKGFPGDAITEFSVSSPELIKKIAKSDLVEFEIEETRGDAQIVKITRIGQAPPKEEGMPLGNAAGDILRGAGSIVKTVASPIAPVGDVAEATTNATGSALSRAEREPETGNTQVKRSF